MFAVVSCAPPEAVDDALADLPQPAFPEYTSDAPLPTPGNLFLSSSDFVPGQTTYFRISGVNPNARVGVVRGTSEATPGACPVPSFGLCFDINGVSPLGLGRADAFGVAEIALAVPSNIGAGLNLVLQAADIDGGDTSNVVTTQVLEQDSYVTVPQAAYSTLTFQGLPVHYNIPSNPKGVIWLFHGGGGEADWFDGVEGNEWVSKALARGFGFISTESVNRASEEWDNGSLQTSTNPDLDRLYDLRAHLVGLTSMGYGTPLFSVGFSNGGTFASTFSEALNDWGWVIKGTVIHNSLMAISTLGQSGAEVPTMWVLAENDDAIDNTQAYDQYDDHVAMGRNVALLEAAEAPLDATRFVRIDDIDDLETLELYQGAYEAGLISKTGIRLRAWNRVDQAINDFKASYDGPGENKGAGQIRVVWTTHRFDARNASAELNWMESLL